MDLRCLAQDWRRLTHAEQAGLRYVVMRSMCWTEWDAHPQWWWDTEHIDLLSLKCASGRGLAADCQEDTP